MGFSPVSLHNVAFAVADLARSVSSLTSTFPMIAVMRSANGAFLRLPMGPNPSRTATAIDAAVAEDWS